MDILLDPSALRARCDAFRAEGERVGFIPTMGALHEGHLALIDEARKQGATRIVVSVFVNPLQFGPKDDFSRYPRTLPPDAEACASRGVDVVFAPNNDAMYPNGFVSQVRVAKLSETLEGVFRPGHFDGVTTVVCKLLNLVGPSIAVFGRKDYQQWKVLERMVRDLDMPMQVVGMRTVRDQDGLARSSRNRYLSEADRVRALAISAGLRAASKAFAEGERAPATLERLARAHVEPAFDTIDYVAIADADTLQPIEHVTERALLVVAARIGTTRLIDNLVLGEEAIP